MIQRIQTLYLLLAAGLVACAAFLPLASFASGGEEFRQHQPAQTNDVFAAHQLFFCHRKHAAVLAEFAGLIIGQQGHGHHAQKKARIHNKEIGPIHDGNHACAHHDHGGHNDTFGIVPYLISIL